jgi:hypothetical protein
MGLLLNVQSLQVRPDSFQKLIWLLVSVARLLAFTLSLDDLHLLLHQFDFRLL